MVTPPSPTTARSSYSLHWSPQSRGTAERLIHGMERPSRHSSPATGTYAALVHKWARAVLTTTRIRTRTNRLTKRENNISQSLLLPREIFEACQLLRLLIQYAEKAFAPHQINTSLEVGVCLLLHFR